MPPFFCAANAATHEVAEQNKLLQNVKCGSDVNVDGGCAKQRLAATAVGATATAAKEAAERREWQHKEGTAKTASLSATSVAGREGAPRGEGGVALSMHRLLSPGMPGWVSEPLRQLRLAAFHELEPLLQGRGGGELGRDGTAGFVFYFRLWLSL